MSRMIDPARIEEFAKAKEEENFRFRLYLKRKSGAQVDRRVFKLTDQVWAGVDCTTCGNCCRVLRPGVSEEELQRLAARLGQSREEFIAAYLQPVESNDPDDPPWQVRVSPCPFLRDNKCSVYEDRPRQCRDYPYLHRPDFVFRTMGMINRTVTCPIVYEVMEELKRSYDFG